MLLDDEFFDTCKKNMGAALGVNSKLTIREVEEKLTDKQRELIALSPEDERYGLVPDEIYQLRDDKRQVLLDESNRDIAAKRVDELIGFVMEQNGEAVENDESLVINLIEKIIVNDEQIKVVFKSGINVDIEA